MATIRNDITKVKKINIELIKTMLKSHPQSTKAQLAEITGISVVTCGKILNELKAVGEVFEVEQLNTGCGRPATTYRFNANFESVACLYLWSDCKRLELVSEIADLVGKTIYSEVTVLETVDSATLEDAIRALLRRDPSIRVVVLGVPGSVNRGKIYSSYLLALNGVYLQDLLSAAFPEVKIIVENAARAAAYGYSVSAPLAPNDIVSYFFIPTEVCTGRHPHEILSAETASGEDTFFRKPLLIDVGLVCDRRIIRGFSGFAGSLGMFLPLNLYCDIPADVIANLFSTLVPVLNPTAIVVTGNGMTRDKLEAAEKLCAAYIPAEHMPRIVLRADCRLDYSQGLTLIALQELACEIELVQKQI